MTRDRESACILLPDRFAFAFCDDDDDDDDGDVFFLISRSRCTRILVGCDDLYSNILINALQYNAFPLVRLCVCVWVTL
jgi:hypothetical protein